MKIEETIIKRLIFVKYLYTLAVEQSYRPEPFCYVSILLFHDSVELFNQLILETKCDETDIKKKADTIRKRRNFMEYWQIIDNLGYEVGMDKFNKARVFLKHYGNYPSKTQIDNYRVFITSFFEENTSKLLDRDFSELSLIDLIEYEPSKINLKEAEGLIKENKIVEAIDKIALAFSQLIRDYEGKKSIFGKSLFLNTEKIYSNDIKNLGVDNKYQIKIEKVFGKIIKSIESAQSILKIIALGIDYKKYAKFNLITPKILWPVEGTHYISRNSQQNVIPTMEDVEYCLNFVIETAILLQNIDYELESDGFSHRIKRKL